MASADAVWSQQMTLDIDTVTDTFIDTDTDTGNAIDGDTKSCFKVAENRLTTDKGQNTNK